MRQGRVDYARGSQAPVQRQALRGAGDLDVPALTEYDPDVCQVVGRCCFMGVGGEHLRHPASLAIHCEAQPDDGRRRHRVRKSPRRA
jgi:hypothetical protein